MPVTCNHRNALQPQGCQQFGTIPGILGCRERAPLGDDGVSRKVVVGNEGLAQGCGLGHSIPAAPPTGHDDAVRMLVPGLGSSHHATTGRSAQSTVGSDSASEQHDRFQPHGSTIAAGPRRVKSGVQTWLIAGATCTNLLGLRDLKPRDRASGFLL